MRSISILIGIPTFIIISLLLMPWLISSFAETRPGTATRVEHGAIFPFTKCHEINISKSFIWRFWHVRGGGRTRKRRVKNLKNLTKTEGRQLVFHLSCRVTSVLVWEIRNCIVVLPLSLNLNMQDEERRLQRKGLCFTGVLELQGRDNYWQTHSIINGRPVQKTMYFSLFPSDSLISLSLSSYMYR